MGNTLIKVSPGDPLEIAADTWNTVLDSAQEFQQRRQNQTTGRGLALTGGLILVKNTSGADRNRFDVLGIDAPVFTPTDSLDSFKNTLALKGVSPTAASHTGRFVVLQEPLAANAIGRAIAHGVTPCQVNFVDAAHGYADVNDGVATSLKSGSTGAARVLWKETGTGVKWAVVLLGGAGGGPAAPSAFMAKIISSSGSAQYVIREQQYNSGGVLGDKPGASDLTATNLAEIALGPGTGMTVGAIVLAMAVQTAATPPVTRYVFSYPVYAKYLD